MSGFVVPSEVDFIRKDVVAGGQLNCCHSLRATLAAAPARSLPI